MSERKFILRNDFIRSNLVAFLKGLSLGELTEVIVRPYVEKRTNPQNRRMWLLHGMAGAQVGCSSEDMHEDTLCHFYGYEEVRLPSGATKRKPMKRTSGMNKREFSEHMQRLEAFYISELGVWLDKEAA